MIFNLAISYPVLAFTDNREALTVYGYDNFEMYSPGADVIKFASVSAKTDVNAANKIAVEESGGNKYLQYVCAQRDPLVDFLVDITDDEFVFDADFVFGSGKGDASLFFVISDAAKITTVRFKGDQKALLDAEGNVLASNINTTDTYRVSIAVNQSAKIYDVYLNGNQIGFDISFSDASFTHMKKFRLTAYGGVPIKFKMDNWILYSGNKPVEDKSAHIRNTHFYESDEVYGFLGEGVAFSPDSDCYLKNSEKHYLPNCAIEADGEVYISRDFAAIFGVDKAEDFIMISDKSYISADALCEETGLEFYRDANNLCIISEEKKAQPSFLPREIENYDAHSRRMLEINNLLFYSMPDADEIKSAYSSKSHPRLILDTEDFERIRSEILTDTLKASWFAGILAKADSFLTLDTPVYEKPDGKRLNVHSYAEPIRTLALCCRLCTDEVKAEVYADKAIELMTAISEYSDWNHSGHFLDIGVIMGSIAIGYDWLYEKLSDDEKLIIEDAMYNKGLIPAWLCYLGDIRLGKTWVQRTGNWNCVVNSGVILACSALADVYPEFSFQLTEYALRSLEYSMNSYAPDGGWEEGLSYYNYTTRHLCYIIEALESAYGTDFGLYDARGVSESPMFALALSGSVEGFNFHDASGGRYYTAELSWHGAKQNSALIQSARYNQIRQGATPNAFDLVYLDTAKINEVLSLPEDVYFEGVQTGSMRSGYFDSQASYVGYHCGRNSAWHGQYDSGTFVFDQLGVRWALDLGTAEYDLATAANSAFGTPIYKARAEGQNVYVINPDKTPGQKAETKDYVEKSCSDEQGAFTIMNLTDAYSEYTSKARRGISLTNHRNSLTVRDEIDFKESSEFYWFMHTRAAISISGNTAYLTQNGKTMKLTLLSNQPLVLSVGDAVQMDEELRLSGEGINTGIRKLIISGNVSGHMDMEVQITPVIDGVETGAFIPAPLDEWTLQKSYGFCSDIDMFSITSDGTLVKTENLSGNMRFDFKVVGLNRESQSANAVAMLYSGDEMIEILWSEAIEADRLKAVTKTTLKNLDGIKNPKLKLMVIKDFESLAPLMQAKGVCV